MMTGKCFGGHLGKLVLAFVLAGIAAQVASAKDSGFYVGVNRGGSMFENEPDLNHIFDFQTSQGQDDTDTNWSLSAGYRFNRYVGLELSYVDFGKTTLFATGTDIGIATPQRIDAQASVKGPTLALIGTLPFGRFELNGRLGVLFANTDVSSSLTSSTVNLSGSDSASTTNAALGVGAGYTIADHYHIRVDWTHYADVGDKKDTGQRNIDTLTVGFAYRF